MSKKGILNIRFQLLQALSDCMAFLDDKGLEALLKHMRTLAPNTQEEEQQC